VADIKSVKTVATSLISSAAQTYSASLTLSRSVVSVAVLLCDSDPRTRERVASVAKSSGADLRVESTDRLGTSHHPVSDTTIALIALAPKDAATHFQAIARLKSQCSDVVVYGPGWDRAPLAIRSQALLAGASCVLDTDSSIIESELTRRLRSMLEVITHRDEEQRRLRDIMARVGIVGTSRVMLALARWLVRISALSDLPVLISGETGTGKELIARAIHALDQKRGRGPFVPLNCAALTPSLAESELFGHHHGAFTGAIRDRRGLIRSAHGGVLFLDEIGDLDIDLQGKLLRVLQENRVLGVGEDREEAISVRVIAATNRDLQQMVGNNRFRADLFYRLNVLNARAPALSERPEDIPLLVAHFLERDRGARMTASASFIAALSQVDLSGNVRQLENLVRRAVAHAGDDRPLDLEDLPAEVWKELSSRAEAVEASASSARASEWWPAVLDANGWNLTRSLSACERTILQAALARMHGNQSKTARLLGVTPRSIYTKLRKHRLAG
jgi:transcriptional regulator with GAF, ATPase, and Fis domain